MKILLTVRTFTPPFTGGVDVYADRLAKSLRRLGHETVFLALNSASGEAAIQISRGEYETQLVWRLSFDLNQRPKSVLDQAYDPEMGAAFRQILLEEKPDLLIILNFYLLSMASVEVAKSLGIRVIHIATDFVPICRRATLIRWNGEVCREGESVKSCSTCFVAHRLSGKWAAGTLNRLLPESILTELASDHVHMHRLNPLRLLSPYWKQVEITSERLEKIGPLRRAVDLVVTPTRFTREMFARHGFDPKKVKLLPFAVEEDSPLAQTEKKPSGSVRFVFIGRLQPYKGVHVLVEAFNLLENAGNARLSIYGKQDGYDEYFKRLIESVKKNDRIRFEGSIPPDRLDQAFAEADYFILPSIWHENTPLILLDALQSGTPVIASDIGGVRDSIQDEVNGFLFPMGDVAALAKLLQRCIDHPEYLQTLKPGADLSKIDDYAAELLSLLDETGTK